MEAFVVEKGFKVKKVSKYWKSEDEFYNSELQSILIHNFELELDGNKKAIASI